MVIIGIIGREVFGSAGDLKCWDGYLGWKYFHEFGYLGKLLEA
jgi:hypothetical protein